MNILITLIKVKGVTELTKVLFVCLGNICRSPMAEGLMRKFSQEQGIDLNVDSAGTSDWEEGNLPHLGTQKILYREGIDYRQFVSRPITQADFAQSDWIIGMDAQNKYDLLQMAPRNSAEKIYLYMDVVAGKEKEIPDPWYTGDFEGTYRMIKSGLAPWLEKFK